jgi:hypothetical protein
MAHTLHTLIKLLEIEWANEGNYEIPDGVITGTFKLLAPCQKSDQSDPLKLGGAEPANDAPWIVGQWPPAAPAEMPVGCFDPILHGC